MFRRVLVFIACLLLACNVIAQTTSYFNKPDHNGQDRIFFGGLVLGLNACQIDGDTYSGYHKAGLNTGVIAYVKLHPKALLSIELLYSQKGARNVQIYNSPAVGSMPIIYTAKLNYIEIPVMVHYPFTDKIQGGIGLSYGRLFTDKESMDSYTSSRINTNQNTFRQQDVNYLIGVSYQLVNNLFVRMRYQYSLLSIRDANKIPIEFGTPAQYNNLFAMQLVCLF